MQLILALRFNDIFTSSSLHSSFQGTNSLKALAIRVLLFDAGRTRGALVQVHSSRITNQGRVDLLTDYLYIDRALGRNLAGFQNAVPEIVRDTPKTMLELTSLKRYCLKLVMEQAQGLRKLLLQ